MALDLDKIKEIVEEVVEKLKSDDDLLKNFKEEPVKTLEKLLNVDLPDDQINAVIDGIKTKLDIEDLKESLGGIADKLNGLGGIFNKK